MCRRTWDQSALRTGPIMTPPMSLPAGTRIGSYQIVSAIGAGGMGEVYRAHDSKLGRDVALKILPDVFAHDAERLARFEREARTLASLNHPNIAAIYGIEESAVPARETRRTVRALVMELVTGDDLTKESPPDRSRSPTRWRSPVKSRSRSKPRTKRASSIAI